MTTYVRHLNAKFSVDLTSLAEMIAHRVRSIWES